MVLPPEVRAREPVPITLRLTNTSRRAVTVNLQGRPVAFDLIVTRLDGTLIWRRLDRAFISAILQVREIAPGEVLEFSDTWSQQNNGGEKVEAGEYVVRGVLPSDPPAELRTEPVPLRILL